MHVCIRQVPTPIRLKDFVFYLIGSLSAKLTGKPSIFVTSQTWIG